MAEIPPPPENPFGGEPDPLEYENEQPLDQGAPNVAAKPGKALVVVGVVGAVVLTLVYLIFFSGGKEKKPDAEKKVSVAAAPAEPPKPPPLIKDIPPAAPMGLPAPPPIPKPRSMSPFSILSPEEDDAAKKQAQARMHSGMFVGGTGKSGGGIGSVFGGSSNTPAPKDENVAFAANVAAATSRAERVTATHIGDLRRTIAQGRIIQATTESAINTDLPAPIRAIVSRDTYAEAGTEPLIPKGSRLIGQYNTSINGGQSRVMVVWTRVIRPDGVDVALGSPLVDQLGQAGIGGQVDTKFQQVFSRSVLASIMNIALAIGADELNPNPETTTSTDSSGSTSQSSAASDATTNALNRLGATTDSFLQNFINASPTILVDQGTPVNVFVNRDLIFPDDVVGARIVN